LTPPEKHSGQVYRGLTPGKKVQLPVGHIHSPGFGAFREAAVLEIDLRVPMRDGINLYTNVYRPADEARQPALIAWSPYGKCCGDKNSITYDSMGPYHIGIPYQSLSGYETFEGPNPADWIERGYCVVDPDARGAMRSEGNMVIGGPQEAIDIYDLIEWCIKQPWCDGTAVMFGNSWLAIAQMTHASRCPHPALKAIAPWEALNNFYNDTIARGGVTQRFNPFSYMYASRHMN
jgi:putative CocE/NonD family hydrolase